MTTVSAPFGGRAVYNPGGPAPRPTVYPDGILSGYTTAIYKGAPVKMATTGVIQAATGGESILGFFEGCIFSNTGQILPTFSIYWPASQAYIAGTMQAIVYDNPNYQYEMQSAGSVAQSAIGDEADFAANPGSGNSLNFSTCALSTSLAGAGATGQMRIVGLSEMVNNAWGDAYTVVRCQIAAHQYVSQKAAI